MRRHASFVFDRTRTIHIAPLTGSDRLLSHCGQLVARRRADKIVAVAGFRRIANTAVLRDPVQVCSRCGPLVSRWSYPRSADALIGTSKVVHEVTDHHQRSQGGSLPESD